MQTLGLSDSGSRSEGRLKSLFWPSIQTGSDVDYLGAQGYWVCAIVAVFSFVFLIVMGNAIAAVFVLLFYYLGGVGVREHSLYAAIVVLVAFVADTLVSPSALKVFLLAVLLSNLRATWIASHWKPESGEAALPPRLSATWGDRFVDTFPMWLWPKVEVPYYVLSVIYLIFSALGLATMILPHHS
jgi:hypothetical protein